MTYFILQLYSWKTKVLSGLMTCIGDTEIQYIMESASGILQPLNVSFRNDSVDYKNCIDNKLLEDETIKYHSTVTISNSISTSFIR